MNTLNSYWKNLSTNLHLWLFQCFLISFPLSVRKVLAYYSINDQFNEYSGIYLYLSDVFLFFTLLAWLVSILGNKSRDLSIVTKHPLTRKFLFAFAILALWSLLSISWATNIPVATFRSIKLVEWFCLVIYLLANVPRGTFAKQALQTIVLLGSIESIIGISQFIFQHSLELSWLRESVIATDIPGVAKIIFNGKKYIRAYGTFPHPNVFAGFLSLSGILSFIGLSKESFNFQFNQNKWLKLAIILQIVALGLTFSKSAILGLLMGLLILFYTKLTPEKESSFMLTRIVPRGTISFFKNLAPFKKVLLLSVAMLALLTLSKFDLTASIIQPIKERLIYINVSRGTILNNPIFGSGAGQFVLNMAKYSQKTLLVWEFQPVHNVFLLIWSELGLIGLISFFLVGLASFKTIFRENNIVPPAYRTGRRGTIFTLLLKLAFISQITILLFDHYHWDIQQGQILLWLFITLPFLLQKETTEK